MQNKTSALTVYDWLLMEPDRLWSYIKIENIKAQGHGGQKVNKTSSAVKLFFSPLNLSISCQKYRYREENKTSAFRRLREEIAFKAIDTPPQNIMEKFKVYFDNGLHINPKNNDFPMVIAIISGIYNKENGIIKKTAEKLNVTHSCLNRFILGHKQLALKCRKESNS